MPLRGSAEATGPANVRVFTPIYGVKILFEDRPNFSTQWQKIQSNERVLKHRFGQLDFQRSCNCVYGNKQVILLPAFFEVNWHMSGRLFEMHTYPQYTVDSNTDSNVDNILF